MVPQLLRDAAFESCDVALCLPQLFEQQLRALALRAQRLAPMQPLHQHQRGRYRPWCRRNEAARCVKHGQGASTSAVSLTRDWPTTCVREAGRHASGLCPLWSAWQPGTLARAHSAFKCARARCNHVCITYIRFDIVPQLAPNATSEAPAPRPGTKVKARSRHCLLVTDRGARKGQHTCGESALTAFGS